MAALLVAGGAARASVGCDNATGTSSANGGGGSTSTISPFAAGDTLTFQITRAVAGQGSFSLKDGSGKVLLSDPAGGTSVSLAYSVLGNADTTLVIALQSTGTLISVTTTCTGNIVSATNRVRAMQVQLSPMVALTSGAAITGAIDGAISDAFAERISSFAGSQGSVRFNLLPDQEADERMPREFDALAYRGRGTRPPTLDRTWSVWVDGRGTNWNQTGGTEVRANQINVTAGLGRKFTPDLLAGLFAGYEDFKYDVPTLAGTLKGSGWTTGVYVASRLSSTLRIDGALALSNVNYNVNATASAGAVNGTSSGTFTGNRGLGSFGITGIYPSSGVIVEPSARVIAMLEKQKAWTDSNNQDQGGRTFLIGRGSVGAKLSYPLPGMSSLSVTPYVGAYGDYRFSRDDALPVAVTNFGVQDGLSGRAVAGLSLAGQKGATFTVGGELGGLGQVNQRLWTLMARGTVPF